MKELKRFYKALDNAFILRDIFLEEDETIEQQFRIALNELKEAFNALFYVNLNEEDLLDAETEFDNLWYTLPTEN